MRTTPNRGLSLLRLAGIACLGAALFGCQDQRPIGMVQADGDRAMLDGRPTDAIEYYQQWVDRQPHRPEAQHSLGLALMESGRTSQAVEHLTVAHDLEPTNDVYFSDMARAMRDAGREQTLIANLRSNAAEKGRLIDYLRLGDNLMELGLMDEAHQAYKTAADIDAGRTVEPQLRFAELFRRLDRPQEQIRRLRIAYGIDPTDERVLARLAALDVIPGPSLALPPDEAP